MGWGRNIQEDGHIFLVVLVLFIFLICMFLSYAVFPAAERLQTSLEGGVLGLLGAFLTAIRQTTKKDD